MFNTQGGVVYKMAAKQKQDQKNKQYVCPICQEVIIGLYKQEVWTRFHPL